MAERVEERVELQWPCGMKIESSQSDLIRQFVTGPAERESSKVRRRTSVAPTLRAMRNAPNPVVPRRRAVAIPKALTASSMASIVGSAESGCSVPDGDAGLELGAMVAIAAGDAAKMGIC